MCAKQSPRSRAQARRNGIGRRWWFWVAVVGIVASVTAVFIFTVGTRVMAAKAELESAQALVPQLRAQAGELDIEGAAATLKATTAHTTRAVELADGAIWRFAEITPWLGGNLTAVRELASVTNSIMTDVASPLIGVAGSLDPTSFAPQDGAINLQPLIAAGPAVLAADAGVSTAITAVAAIDTSGTIEQIGAVKDQIETLLAELKPITESLGNVVPMLPLALGSEAPRTYVVMFQNNAESRALGGTALSFAVAKVDQGAIQLVDTRPAGFSTFPGYLESIIPVPDGVLGVYQDTFGTFIANATVRPSFISAAETVRENWNRTFPDEQVDGVLSIDPVALSYILRATGPIPLASGDVLTHQTLVPLLLNDVYLRFDSGSGRQDNLAQDAIYGEAVNATFERVSSGSFDAKAFVAALTQGWDERRLLYWSADVAEQAQLARIGLNGEIPRSDDDTERVGVYFQDNVGSKMNFYLSQTVRLAQADCADGGSTNYRVSVDLTNGISPELAPTLPISVVGAYQREKLSPGLQRMFVIVYAPPGSTITGATMDGAPVDLADLHDTDFPVGKQRVSLPPGASSTVTFDFTTDSAGDVAKAFEAQVTPMVNATPITTEALDCSTVGAG